MNIENIHIGDVLQNQRELCDILGVPYKSQGSSRECQLNDFKRYFNWEKSGHKFIITDIYDTPLEKIIKRNNNLGHYKLDNGTYQVEKELNTKYGVYKIQLGDDVYIGSTIRGFRNRYRQHYQNRDNLMPHTQKMLQSGAKFKVVWVAPKDSTEDEIRIKEQYFIEQYKLNGQYNVLNSKDVDIPKYRKSKTKIKKKRIAVKEDDYELVKILLKEHNIDIFDN